MAANGSVDFRIERDLGGIATSFFGVPIISSIAPPKPIKGSIAYDNNTSRLYQSDGITWTPVGDISSFLSSYSQIKALPQVISPSTPTILSGWDILSSPAYNSIPQWDLSAGIYTATNVENLTVNVNLSWSANISNLGNRIVRVCFYDFSEGTMTIIKESVTQADPNIRVQTTQELQTLLFLEPGDQVFIDVEHNAPTALEITGGSTTSLVGKRTQV